MSGDASTPGSKEPQGVAGQKAYGKSRHVRLPGRPRRGVPALLDWIDEAEAINRAAAARLQVAVLIAVFILLLLARLGYTP